MTLLEFPELRQVCSYDCGACSLTSVLTYYGIDAREDQVLKLSGTTEDGANVADILRVLDHHGLAHKAGYMMAEEVKAAIDRREPVILTLQAYRDSSKPYHECWKDGHYVVAIGYDGDRIIFEDPSSFKRTWLTQVRQRGLIWRESCHIWCPHEGGVSCCKSLRRENEFVGRRCSGRCSEDLEIGSRGSRATIRACLFARAIAGRTASDTPTGR